jgi:MOSC domain-containing protein YiiM
MGKIESIFIANPRSPMRAVDSAHAVPGKGLDGDRYFDKAGTFSNKSTDDREITLIESEAIEALRREYNVELAPHESRRNLLTSGVALNHLVGADFRVGDIMLRGLRLCEPCGHLAKLTRPGVREGLIHRGGLRAKILSEGVIHVGDEVRVSASG